jgi:membrane protein YqaA with SNARE-associated domain
MNLYFDIFIEHFQRVLLVPSNKDITLSTLRYMQPDELFIVPILVACAAIACGGMLNWMIGYFFSNYRGAFHGMSEDDYTLFSRLMNKYGVALVVVWWLPVGTVLPFIAGFFRVRWTKEIILLIFGYGLKLIVE